MKKRSTSSSSSSTTRTSRENHFGRSGDSNSNTNNINNVRRGSSLFTNGGPNNLRNYEIDIFFLLFILAVCVLFYLLFDMFMFIIKVKK